MASTAWVTTSPLWLATSRVLAASSLACWAFSEFFRTVSEISTIEAEVCSRLAACCSVRCDRSGRPPRDFGRAVGDLARRGRDHAMVAATRSAM